MPSLQLVSSETKQTLGHLITSLAELLVLFASTSFMLNQDA